MAVNYTIPDHLLDQLYHPDNPSPNSDVFTQNKFQRLPIPVLSLDNVTSWTSDCLQDVQKQIDAIEIAGIGVEGLQNQFLYYSADNVLGAVSLQDMLNRLDPLDFDGSNISDATIYGKSIRDQTIKGRNILDLTILDKQIGNVSGAKIIPRSTPISCLAPPQNASVLCGTTANRGSWYEEPLNPGQVISKKANDFGSKAMDLSDVWDNSAKTFDGGRLDPTSIDGSIAMMSNKTPLATMKSAGGINSLVCGNKTDNKFTEITINDLEVISVTSNGIAPTSQKVSTLLNNEGDGVLKGSKLKDKTVPVSTIIEPVTSFAWAKIDGNGNIKTAVCREVFYY